MASKRRAGRARSAGSGADPSSRSSSASVASAISLRRASNRAPPSLTAMTIPKFPAPRDASIPADRSFNRGCGLPFRRRVIWLKGFGIQQGADPLPVFGEGGRAKRGRVGRHVSRLSICPQPRDPARRAIHRFRGDGAPQGPHASLPLTLALSPRREERRGERGRALPTRRAERKRASPLPIVLHDGERVGVRGRCGHRRLDPSCRGDGAPKALARSCPSP